MKNKRSGSSIAAIHLDLTGSVEDSREQLNGLQEMLKGPIRRVDGSDHLTLTNDHEYLAKFSELMGHRLRFRITHAAPDHDSRDSVPTANELVARLRGVHVQKGAQKTIVEFPERATIEFGKEGIIKTSSNTNLVGKDCLSYIACNVHEDFGVAVAHHAIMTYEFDSAMFEKTPKDVSTGENAFVGRDFIGFHSKGKNFGPMMPHVFEGMLSAFYKKQLEMLTIDLRGVNVFTNGKMNIRRFERDYAVPIMQPDFRGILVYTDVFFQDVNEPRSPFNGGSYLEIECPVKFHDEFRVKQNGT
jgi:hypothetical protein